MIALQRRLSPLLVLSLIGIGLSSQSQAGNISGIILGSNGQAAADTVLFATPLDTPVPPANAAEPAIVAQENSAFVPYVTVIRTGTSVRFPNRDSHDHHLKSFSTAKSFELRVYNKKEEPAPVLFDKAGDVALVCHFHNWMRGFIYVVDTPYFAKTNANGQATLSNLPPGRYEVKAWAPYMFGSPLAQTIRVGAGNTPVKFQLSYVPKPAPAPRMPAKEPEADYSY